MRLNKCVFNIGNAEAAALVINLRHVEPDRYVQLVRRQIQLCGTAEPLLLAAVHKLTGQGDGAAPPKLDLSSSV